MFNPLQMFSDHFERREMKGQVLRIIQTIFASAPPGALIDLKDISITGQGGHPDQRMQMMVMGIVREICFQYPQWSLVDFKGGVGIARTIEVESLPERIRAQNVAGGNIIIGGSDKLVKEK